MLSTIRDDGSPRISPVEPYLLGGELVIGVMPSPKANDLRRDARCAVHSSVSKLDGSEGEFKIHGRAFPTTEPAIVEAAGTWWSGRPADRCTVFAVEIDEATLITWSTAQDRMQTRRWTRDRGTTATTRTYP